MAEKTQDSKEEMKGARKEEWNKDKKKEKGEEER
jgi:hypothetical protein